MYHVSLINKVAVLTLDLDAVYGACGIKSINDNIVGMIGPKNPSVRP
jgi:hypothetical protein